MTGASGGIGAAIAKQLHAQGATVVLAGRRQAALAALAEALGERVRVELAELAEPEAAERLQGVARLLSSPTSSPALLLAAVVHAEVATAAPFASHNGIVARALERLVLVSRGVDAKSLVVPEAGHLAQRAAYESNLRAYSDGGPRGVHAWALYGAEAFSAGAEASPLRG